MLLAPTKGRVLHQHNWGTVGTTSPGTSVTTGSPSTSKGSVVELISSTNFDAYWIEVFACNYVADNTASAALLDILVGAATEEVLIPNLVVGYAQGPGGSGFTHPSTPRNYGFPLYIPAGTRIAAQAAGNRTSTAMRVGVRIIGGNGSPSFQVGRKVTTYGIGTVPDGTSITPGASGAEGSWTEITASTSEDHFALTPGFQGSGTFGTNERCFAVDIGIGAATEEEVVQSYLFWQDDGEEMYGPFPSFPAFLPVPSGSRLTMRASNSGTNNSYTAAIHAVS